MLHPAALPLPSCRCAAALTSTSGGRGRGLAQPPISCRYGPAQDIDIDDVRRGSPLGTLRSLIEGMYICMRCEKECGGGHGRVRHDGIDTREMFRLAPAPMRRDRRLAGWRALERPGSHVSSHDPRGCDAG